MTAPFGKIAAVNVGMLIALVSMAATIVLIIWLLQIAGVG